MANVIREDVVKLSFDTDLGELKKLTNIIDDLKKGFGDGLGDDELKDLKENAKSAQKSVEGLKDKIKNLAKTSLDKLKNGVSNLGTKLKDIAQMSFAKLKNWLSRIKTQLSDIAKRAATTAFNGLKRVASMSFKALALGVGAVAVAVGKIGYESVQAFADFEQLKGGVETLFGAGGLSLEDYAKSVGKSMGAARKEYKKLMASQETVLTNANNAYKTAGLSANDYMETITGFSASLISSVGGDTKKAADLADMAIRDMADNANKMGTDMDSIIQTYQSLARGNYAMLDNLKLGYGGTKEELKRLISDAAKLDKSVDANSLSYANIVKAIHAVQDEMGIYGTTQKEAEKTVTGSLNAMKASWGNLLTAMGSGENLDQCIDNMVSSVETFAGNVMPVAERALLGLGTVIEKLAPIIAEKLPDLAEDLLPPLIKATVSLAKGLIKSLPNIIKTIAVSIVDIFGEQFPIIKKIGDFFKNNAKSIGESIGKIIPFVLGLVAAFKGFQLISGIFSIFGKGKGGKGGLFDGLTKTLKNLAKTKPAVILKGMANLGIIMGGLVILTAAIALVSPYLAELTDFRSFIEVVTTIGILGAVATAMAKLGEIAGKIPVSTVAKGLANMAIMIGGLSALFLVIGAVSLIDFDLKKMTAIIGIIGILGVVGAALTVFAGIAGAIPVVTVALGLANIAIIIAGMSALFLLIGAVSLLDFNYVKMLKIVGIIGILGTVGATLTVFAGIVGAIPVPVVLNGLANMALVLGGVSALIVAFGALSEIKGFNEFIEKGGAILTKIFNVIGEMVGSLIGGLGEGLTKSLPKIGKNLSAFAESLKPMFSAFSGVDMGSVGTFFEAIGAFMLQMSGSKMLEFFTGSPDFSGVADGLNSLATNEGVKKFFNMVNSIEEGAFNKGKLFFECLDGVKSLPNAGGLGELFGGKNDFSGVASGLGQLASEGVKKFFAMVNGMETTAFDNAKSFFECLSYVKKLPNAGGLSEVFGGKNDFSGVAQGLTDLSSEGVKNFFAMVSGLDQKAFDNTTALFETLAGMGDLTSGDTFWERLKDGLFGDDDGKTQLQTIAEGLGDFSEKTKTFFSEINNLNLEKLNGLWNSLEKAGELTTENLGSVVDESISNIVEKIKNLPKQMGDALKNNSKHLSDGFVEMWKDAVKASVAPVNKLLDGANHILKEFGSKKKVISWTPYARGTDGHRGGNALVNDGRGAELVQMPNGRMFIPNGRNVFLPNAPKGMKVLPAERTAQLLGKRSPTFNYADGIGDVDIWSYYDNSKGLVNKLTESISYEGMSSLASSIGSGMVSTFAGEMPAWIDKLFEESGQSLASYVASKGVTQWLPTVIRALKMEGQYSASNVARTLFQMKTESGGNPKAINLWDSNAKKGIPSKGLMQVIDPTFQAYARSGYNKNIYDPLSNILASVRYAVSRYGSLSKAYRGVGYSKGVGTVNIPSQPSSMNMSYTPESDARYYSSTNIEYNTYSPQFSLTIEGGNDDRALARKVKRWVSEAMEEAFNSLERKSSRLQEV